MSDTISGKTKICGIMGDPIEHTVSPAMQNAAFKKLGLDYVYVPFFVKSADLNSAIKGMRALNIRGLNVTIPHKVAVIPLLDEIDSLSENLAAVNTIVNIGGCLKGYNTDASGFWRALQSEDINPAGKKTVILGAGGAARAIAFILADKGADLTIMNRHPETGQNLAERIAGLFRREVNTLELSKDNLEIKLKETEIIVNTTSVGMFPNVKETPIPVRLIQRGQIVFDVIYNPAQTRLLTASAKKGAKVISGVEMLVQQGAAAFEIWTGRKAPVDTMREAAVAALGKNED
jgi:shikimate dehydrogenase